MSVWIKEFLLTTLLFNPVDFVSLWGGFCCLFEKRDFWKKRQQYKYNIKVGKIWSLFLSLALTSVRCEWILRNRGLLRETKKTTKEWNKERHVCHLLSLDKKCNFLSLSCSFFFHILLTFLFFFFHIKISFFSLPFPGFALPLISKLNSYWRILFVVRLHFLLLEWKQKEKELMIPFFQNWFWVLVTNYVLLDWVFLSAFRSMLLLFAFFIK